VKETGGKGHAGGEGDSEDESDHGEAVDGDEWWWQGEEGVEDFGRDDRHPDSDGEP